MRGILGLRRPATSTPFPPFLLAVRAIALPAEIGIRTPLRRGTRGVPDAHGAITSKAVIMGLGAPPANAATASMST